MIPIPTRATSVFVNSIGTSTGGSAGGAFGAAFFNDDATLGGSFTYNASDDHATSSNFATVTVVNNATTTTTLTGTGANEILIATQGNEALNGGGGNDILFGYGGNHVLTGGSGNDTFAFQTQPTGTNVITDFNNTTRARPHRGLREQFRRRADGGPGRDVGVRDVRRRSVLRKRRGIPLR